MKKKIVSAVFVAAIAIAAGYTMKQNAEKNDLSDITLANVEALAQSEGDQAKKYRYVETGQDCVVYVGGAYAKGKKIMCLDGNDHAECSDCKL